MLCPLHTKRLIKHTENLQLKPHIMPYTRSKSFTCPPLRDSTQTHLLLSTRHTQPSINSSALPTHKNYTCITHIATHAQKSNSRIIAHPKHIISTTKKIVKLPAHIHYKDNHASPPSECDYTQLAAQLTNHNHRLPATYSAARGEWVEQTNPRHKHTTPTPTGTKGTGGGYKGK
jgi:hypothetical protein